MGQDKAQKPSGATDDGLFRLVCAGIVAVGIGLAIQKLISILEYHWFLAVLIAFTALFFLGFYLFAILQNRKRKKEKELGPTQNAPGAVYLGKEHGTLLPFCFQEEYRRGHLGLLGPTNTGKSASVILPMAVSDMKESRGFIMVDGKGDADLRNQLYAYAEQCGRKNDFMVFSISDPEISATFNPLYGGTPEEITQRMFSALEFQDEYYKSIQFQALRVLITAFEAKGEVPLLGMIYELLRDKTLLEGWAVGLPEDLARDILRMTEVDKDKFLQNYSGIVSQLAMFSSGNLAPLFNAENPDIVLLEALTQKKIIYFQLPTMANPIIGKCTGKLVLQCLQSAISKIQSGGNKLPRLFSVYLDDFNDYIYEDFGSILNKSRSANVGVVFSHQSIGDLEKVSPAFKQLFLDNTNNKIFMRTQDPETAEYCAKVLGTKTEESTTSRRTKSFFGNGQDTGEQSVREVESYRWHPNFFKRDLGTGEGVVIIVHKEGRTERHVHFQALAEIPIQTGALPLRRKQRMNFYSKCKAMSMLPSTSDFSVSGGGSSKSSDSKDKEKDKK